MINMVIVNLSTRKGNISEYRLGLRKAAEGVPFRSKFQDHCGYFPARMS